MTTREQVWKFLSDHDGTYVSGAELSRRLKVSRSAIWKAVESLRDDGVTVLACTNRGYMLGHDGQLSPFELKRLLPDHLVSFHELVDSTNREAKEFAAQGAPPGTVCIALRQSGGRGRLGRSFFSPHGGIYLSLVLRPNPDEPVQDALLVTSAAAVATALAIEEVCGIHCQIKWVNDLYWKGRKVCGILTEGVMDLETGRLSAVIPGIGINFCTQERDFPPDVRSRAGSLYTGPSQVPAGVDQNLLVASLVRHLCTFQRHLSERLFLEEYRRRNLLMGKTVEVFQAGKKTGEGTVCGIDDDAALLLRSSDGSVRALSTGEVSVRLAR